MKKWMFIIGLITGISGSVLSAMKRSLEESSKEDFQEEDYQDEVVYQPEVPMLNLQTGQGYLVDMPTEIKAHIAIAISPSKNLKEAIQAIKALAVANKEFNELINDVRVIKGLIALLAEKFGVFHEHLAIELATQGAKEYIQQNNALTVASFDELFKRPGFDIKYQDRYGRGIIFIALEKKWPIGIVELLISRGAPLYIPDASVVGIPQLQQDLKIFIIKAIAQAGVLSDVVAIIQNRQKTDAVFKQFINDRAVTKTVVNILAAKFGMYTKIVAQQLATIGSLRYIADNQQCERSAWEIINAGKIITWKEVKKLIDSYVLDPRYRNEIGSGPLCWWYFDPNNETVTSKGANRIGILDLLTKRGADIDMITAGGVTVLWATVAREIFSKNGLNLNIIKFILSTMKPALINQQVRLNLAGNLEHNSTVLQTVLGMEIKESTNLFVFCQVIELLINAGADLFLKNDTGHAAIDQLRMMEATKPYNPWLRLPGWRILRFIKFPQLRSLIEKTSATITQAQTLQEAIATIEAQKERYGFIQDFQSVRDLLWELKAKFGGYDETIAGMLSIPGIEMYVDQNKKFMSQCQQGVTLQDLQAFIALGGDPGFHDSEGNSCVTYLRSSAPGVYQPDTLNYLVEIIESWKRVSDKRTDFSVQK